MKREPGYYWVKKYGRWMPAEWVLTNKRCYWNIMGLEYFFDDSEFEEIDENKITRDDDITFIYEWGEDDKRNL